MIYEIERPCATDLAKKCRYPEAVAVISGNNPGWVFGDDRRAPQAALVYAQGIEGFYLVGDKRKTAFLDTLDAHIDQVLAPRLRDLGVDWLEICGDNGWDPLIVSALGKRDPHISKQFVYTRTPGELKPLPRLEAAGGSTLLRVGPQILGDLSVRNRDFLLAKLVLFWGDVAAFVHTGFGYVLMESDAIASLCFSAFVAGNIHAIDIETIQEHRGKGYGETVARAFLAECAKTQRKPYWDCMAENTPSAGLAEKLGLTRSYVYTLYSFKLKP